jgi:hypothetical protein
MFRYGWIVGLFLLLALFGVNIYSLYFLLFWIFITITFGLKSQHQLMLCIGFLLLTAYRVYYGEIALAERSGDYAYLFLLLGFLQLVAEYIKTIFRSI